MTNERKFVAAASDSASRKDSRDLLGREPLTWIGAFADVFTPPEALPPVNLDHAYGYEARARDLQRIGRDMHNAIRALGLSERLPSQ